MDCQTVERENIAERYLAGALDSRLKEEWELHYFSCDRCAEQLATWQAIEKPLRAMEGSIRMEIGPRKTSRAWLWAGTAVAAALLVGMVIKLDQRPQSVQPAAEATIATNPARWAEIAQLQPPAYRPPTLRSAASKADAQFQKAMEPYQHGDYSQAIAGLQVALQLEPEAAAPRFFLGICELLTGNAADGARELERVAAGDSPFAQEAQFNLAKAYLVEGNRQGNKDRALSTLRRLTDTPGEFREPARQLMARIAAMQ
jgi:tetratricopeptide (TPR) repeat protein